MSWKEIERQWHEFVGEAKARWGKLNDNDLAECEGRREKLVGKLQQLYELSQEQAGEAIREIEHRVTEAKRGAEKQYGRDAS